jgi:hypothetical protein
MLLGGGLFMRTLSALLLSSLLSVTAQADATGIWTGFGEWTFQGAGTDCNMTMQYSENEGELRRVKGFFDCGIVALHSDPLTWTKKGNDLFLGEDAAGNSSDAGFFTTENYGDGVHIETKFVRDGLKADYEERWINEKNVEIYKITGRLFLKPR